MKRRLFAMIALCCLGCGRETSLDDINKAELVCSNHGGLSQIYPTVIDGIVLRCLDGLTIKGWTPK